MFIKVLKICSDKKEPLMFVTRKNIFNIDEIGAFFMFQTRNKNSEVMAFSYQVLEIWRRKAKTLLLSLQFSLSV